MQDGMAGRQRNPAPPHSRSRRVFPVRMLVATAAILGIMVLLAFYQAFLARLPRPVAPARLAGLDGLVVLTGGPGRVRFAVSLLQEGAAPQLLVTGVDPRVDDATFRRVFGLSEGLLACCVVLDRTARNTVENAMAIVGWACRRGLRRIGVVSTAWHLPRAIFEIERVAAAAAVRIEIRPLPVPADRRLPYHPRVMREAAKLVLAGLRARLTKSGNPRLSALCRGGMNTAGERQESGRRGMTGSHRHGS